MVDNDILAACTGFEWDEHNAEKNWKKHSVSFSESEEIFSNPPLLVADDLKHSEKEKRFLALGQTYAKRLLYVVLTIRGANIRVISARDMNRKERKEYEDRKKENTKIQG